MMIKIMSYFLYLRRVLPSTPPSVSPTSTPRRSAPMKADHNLGLSTGGHGDSTSNVSHAAQPRLRQHPTLTNKNFGLSETTPQTSKSEGDIQHQSASVPFESYSNVSGTSTSSVPCGSTVPYPSPPSIGRPDRLSSGAARRRTGSPGRVRVVDVTTIVDSHHLAKTCHVASTSIQSPPVTSQLTNVTSGTDMVEQPIENTSGLRPSSANRFRKMVFAYRDGD